jgi:hypothetical protein
VSGFLNRLLVSQGYTLPIVPELDMLTIGKFLNGFSVKILCIKFLETFMVLCFAQDGVPVN